MSVPKILVVDESKLVRAMIGLTLEPLGMDVIEADSGYDAIDRLKANPDTALVIASVEISDLDGVSLTRVIKADPELERIPVILRTLEPNREDRQRALEAGATELLSIEEDRMTFLSRVRALLEPRLSRRRAVILSAAPDVHDTLRSALKETGYQVFEVSTAPEATSVLTRMEAVELAFVDFRLPASQAVVFIRYIRSIREFNRLKLVMLMSEINLEQVLVALRGGVDHYLLDSSTREDLMERLSALGLTSKNPRSGKW